MRLDLMPALIVLSAFVSVPVAALAEGAGPAVLGVRLGMTPSEVRGVLESRYPGLRITQATQGRDATVPGGGEQVVVSFETLTPARDHLTTWFTLMPDEPRVVWITRRSQDFSRPPSVESTRAALIEAYGPAGEFAEGRRGGFDARWNLDPARPDCGDEKLMRLKTLLEAASRNPRWTTENEPAPARAEYACGRSVRASVRTARGEVAALRVELSDPHALAENLARFWSNQSAQSEAIERKRRETTPPPDM